MIILFAPPAKIKQKGWDESVDDYNQVMNTDVALASFTYASLRTKNGPEQINQAFLKAQSEHRPIFIVMDEIQNIKLSTSGTLSKQNKGLLELSTSPLIQGMIGLSATPHPNSYLDAAIYFILAGFYRNVTDFKNQQILIYDERHMPIIKDPYTKEIKREYFRDPDTMDHMLHEITAHMDTEHLLPPVTIIEDICELDDQYPYINDDLNERFQDQTLRTHQGHYKEIIRLHRKKYFEYINTAQSLLRNITMTNPNKLKRLGYWLYEFIYNQKTPVLIFYQYQIEKEAILQFIERFFPKLTIQQVNGAKKEAWQPKTTETVVLIQYAAGGAALEFPHAYGAIFYGPSMYKFQDFDQAKGRNRRSGVTHPITQVLLKTKNTIDMDIWTAIENKKDFSEKLALNYFDIEKDLTVNNPFARTKEG